MILKGTAGYPYESYLPQMFPSKKEQPRHEPNIDTVKQTFEFVDIISNLINSDTNNNIDDRLTNNINDLLSKTELTEPAFEKQHIQYIEKWMDYIVNQKYATLKEKQELVFKTNSETELVGMSTKISHFQETLRLLKSHTRIKNDFSRQLLLLTQLSDANDEKYLEFEDVEQQQLEFKNRCKELKINHQQLHKKYENLIEECNVLKQNYDKLKVHYDTVLDSKNELEKELDLCTKESKGWQDKHEISQSFLNNMKLTLSLGMVLLVIIGGFGYTYYTTQNKSNTKQKYNKNGISNNNNNNASEKLPIEIKKVSKNSKKISKKLVKLSKKTITVKGDCSDDELVEIGNYLWQQIILDISRHLENQQVIESIEQGVKNLISNKQTGIFTIDNPINPNTNWQTESQIEISIHHKDLHNQNNDFQIIVNVSCDQSILD